MPLDMYSINVSATDYQLLSETSINPLDFEWQDLFEDERDGRNKIISAMECILKSATKKQKDADGDVYIGRGKARKSQKIIPLYVLICLNILKCLKVAGG